MPLPRRLASILAPIALAIAWPAAPILAQEPTDSPAEINKSFQDPDVKQFVQRFETESREVFAQRDEIAKAVGLRPGMAVADVGAGTGLFTRTFAEKVGPEGQVFAVDIAPAFLEHIAAESKKRGQGQVRTVLGTQDGTNLPPGSIDVAFLCDVYHHLEHHDRTLASIHRALRPGGRLIIVEFDRKADSSEFIRKHVRADQSTFRSEIGAAGFEPIPTPDAPKLAENFFAEFRKVERPAPPKPSGGE